jgi:hypothetical protein
MVILAKMGQKRLQIGKRPPSNKGEIEGCLFWKWGQNYDLYRSGSGVVGVAVRRGR